MKKFLCRPQITALRNTSHYGKSGVASNKQRPFTPRNDQQEAIDRPGSTRRYAVGMQLRGNAALKLMLNSAAFTAVN